MNRVDPTQSLFLAREEADARVKSQSQASDYLVNEGGLTGVCLGYAIESAEKIARALNSSLQPMVALPNYPTLRTQFYERLLIRAIFESISPNDNWAELRSDWDPELIQKIEEKFISIIENITGIVVNEKKSRKVDLNSDIIGPELLEAATSSLYEPKDHYLVILSNLNRDIRKWHVVYFQPFTGIISDGVSCMSWQIDPKQRDHFPNVVGAYFTRHYNTRSYSLFRARFESIKSHCLPYEKLQFAISTIYYSFQYNPTIGMRYALSYAVPSLIKLGDSEMNFYKSMQEWISKGEFEQLFVHLDKMGHRIPCRGADGWWATLQLPDSYNLDDLYPVLEDLEEMPHTEEISLFILKGMVKLLFRRAIKKHGLKTLLKESSPEMKKVIIFGKQLRKATVFLEFYKKEERQAYRDSRAYMMRSEKSSPKTLSALSALESRLGMEQSRPLETLLAELSICSDKEPDTLLFPSKESPPL